MLINNMKLLLFNFLIVIGVSFANIEDALKIIVLAVTLGYTVWKWIKEAKKK